MAEKVVAWVWATLAGLGHGWCGARLPSLPPTVQQAVTQDGGCWLKAGSLRITHPHPQPPTLTLLFQPEGQNYQKKNIGREEIGNERGFEGDGGGRI